MRYPAFLGCLWAGTALGGNAHMGLSASSSTTVEEKFQDLFVTAGYSTAFGAALGTAILAFTDEPSANLRYVAMGASLGFIGGSLMGTYLAFSPMIVDASSHRREGFLASTLVGDRHTGRLTVRPLFDVDRGFFSGIAGSMTLAVF